MRRVCTLFIMFTAVAGCVGTEVGNPQDPKKSDVSVEFSGYDRQQRGALTLASGIEITEAWMVFDELRLRDAADCSGSDQTDIDRPFAVELVSGRESPALDMFTREATRYCRLELRFAESDVGELPDDVPAELDGLSILVRGEYDGKPFEVRDDFGDRFRIDGDFTLAQGREPLLVAFALDQWLSGTDLEQADGDTQVVIDDETNSDLLDEFRDNVRSSASLFRDRNGDGALQADEQDELAGGDLADDDSEIEESDAGLEDSDADSDDSDAGHDDSDGGDEEDAGL